MGKIDSVRRKMIFLLPEYCLGCIPLKNGCLAMGWLMVVHSIRHFSFLMRPSCLEKNQTKESDQQNLARFLLAHLDNIAAVVNLIVGPMLLYGIHKRKWAFLVPSMILSFTQLIFLMVLLWLAYFSPELYIQAFFGSLSLPLADCEISRFIFPFKVILTLAILFTMHFYLVFLTYYMQLSHQVSSNAALPTVTPAFMHNSRR